MDHGAGIDGGEMRGNRIAIDANGAPLHCQRTQIAADAAAQVGHCASGRSLRLIPGNPFVRGLFETDSREEQARRLREFGGRAAAQLDLFDEQMSPLRRQAAAERGHGRV
jgi:hypothetical protein